jgi:O-acetyl-ADP-ribose deacetylase (regulator of RNase III)
MIRMKSHVEYLNGRVKVLVGDITTVHADAIVNAANSTLLGGGGVDGAIHRTGGPEILAECRAIRRTRYPDGLPVGMAVPTTAGRLPARVVIHTVGPIWRNGGADEERLLAGSYYESLLVARDAGCESVAFPAISTGVYRFPKDRAARISSETVRRFLETEPSINQVLFVFFSEMDAHVFEEHQTFRDPAEEQS